MPRTTPFAVAQLLRLPNVFTAVADPLAGWLLTGGGPAAELALRLGASACLYSAGMVSNDCFDYRLDCGERPERPLPRGAVSRGGAWTLAGVLLVSGLGLAALAGKLLLALFIAVLIWVYNGWTKHFAVLGVCRSANFLLGMPTSAAGLWLAPVILGVYVAVLTFIARREVVDPSIRRVVKRLLLGIIVLDAGLVAVTGNWLGAGWVLALLVPATVLGRMIPMT